MSIILGSSPYSTQQGEYQPFSRKSKQINHASTDRNHYENNKINLDGWSQSHGSASSFLIPLDDDFKLEDCTDKPLSSRNKNLKHIKDIHKKLEKEVTSMQNKDRDPVILSIITSKSQGEGRSSNNKNKIEDFGIKSKEKKEKRGSKTLHYRTYSDSACKQNIDSKLPKRTSMVRSRSGSKRMKDESQRKKSKDVLEITNEIVIKLKDALEGSVNCLKDSARVLIADNLTTHSTLENVHIEKSPSLLTSSLKHQNSSINENNVNKNHILTKFPASSANQSLIIPSSENKTPFTQDGLMENLKIYSKGTLRFHKIKVHRESSKFTDRHAQTIAEDKNNKALKADFPTNNSTSSTYKIGPLINFPAWKNTSNPVANPFSTIDLNFGHNIRASGSYVSQKSSRNESLNHNESISTKRGFDMKKEFEHFGKTSAKWQQSALNIHTLETSRSVPNSSRRASRPTQPLPFKNVKTARVHSIVAEVYGDQRKVPITNANVKNILKNSFTPLTNVKKSAQQNELKEAMQFLLSQNNTSDKGKCLKPSMIERMPNTSNYQFVKASSNSLSVTASPLRMSKGSFKEIILSKH